MIGKSQLVRLALVSGLAAAGAVVVTASPAMAAQACSPNGTYSIYCYINNTDNARAKVPCYKLSNDTLVKYVYGKTVTVGPSTAGPCPLGTDPGSVIVDYSV
ncbi:hypothetical protein [Hamadaea tsunoensis]|uniref:hypothetical protein n=1 Tax=Hamadaea tsunoensis TaxID=53368 RepID=UPI0003F58B3A|nr:hypothetical protein [Hamadaea tsunoensis]